MINNGDELKTTFNSFTIESHDMYLFTLSQDTLLINSNPSGNFSSLAHYHRNIELIDCGSMI
jgi:hypothetical protein